MIVFPNEDPQTDILPTRPTPETSPLPGDDFLSGRRDIRENVHGSREGYKVCEETEEESDREADSRDADRLEGFMATGPQMPDEAISNADRFYAVLKCLYQFDNAEIHGVILGLLLGLYNRVQFHAHIAGVDHQWRTGRRYHFQ
jgi:hypothetical protein